MLLLKCLIEHGCDVTLIIENAGDVPECVSLNLEVITIPQRRGLKLVALAYIKARYRFDCAIAVDSHAFHLAARLVPVSNIFYYSLELYLSTNSYGFDYPPSLAEFERRHINEIAGLIIQSEERERIFRRDYAMRDEIPVFHLPVCADGLGSRTIARQLPPHGLRTVLYVGGIRSRFGVPRFCEAICKIDGWKLLLHGYGSGDEFEELRRRLGEGTYINVSFDDRNFDLPEEVEELCEKADIGLAWYRPGLSPNFDTAALSSGKIAMYLKYGLPIIVRKSGSFVDILEKSGCAIGIDWPEQLDEAISKIEQNYSRMSECAIRTFKEHFDFTRYQDGIIQFMLSHPGLSLKQ